MENATYEIQRDMSKVVRGLLSIVQQQGDLIERLYRAHDALLTALTGGEPDSRPAIDPKATERTRAEIDELRRMFGEAED